MKSHNIILAWQDPGERSWYPVGILSYDGTSYKFVYTHGATESKNFIPFATMSDMHKIYQSDAIFPLFANRILKATRPEFAEYVNWLNLTPDEAQPLMLLAKSGGAKETDSFAVLPQPERNNNGDLEMTFFAHGIRHLPIETIGRFHELRKGQKLFLVRDIQNRFDALSFLLRTDEPALIVGFCPRYLNKDLELLLMRVGSDKVSVTVERLNGDAPLQLRLLCKIQSPWPEDFQPFSSKSFAPLVPE